MWSAVAFGLAVGAGVQAWRNFPADGPLTAHAAMIAAVVGTVAAYLGGRAMRGRGHVSASASAYAAARAEAQSSSTATQQVNVAVVLPGQPSASSSVGAAHLDALPWVGAARPLQGEVDQLLEGYDLSELAVGEQLENDSG